MPAERQGVSENHAGGVSCHETSALIREYVDETMRDRNLRRLLAHVRGCPSCYNELETNFMVSRTIQLLDEDEGRSFNLAPMLEEDLRAKEEGATRRRVMSRLHTGIVLATAVLILFLLLDLTGIFHITRFF